MKKILLVILAFLSLTAFDIKDVKAPSIDSKANRYLKPKAHIRTPNEEGKVIVKEGQTIKFSATATGFPTPTASVSRGFSFHNPPLKNTDRITIDIIGSEVTVSIRNAKRSDSDTYHIYYANQVGYDIVYFTVEVKERPKQS